MANPDRIRSLVANGNIEGAINGFIEEYGSVSEEIANQSSILKLRYFSLRKKRNLGVISSEDADVGVNQIANALLELVSLQHLSRSTRQGEGQVYRNPAIQSFLKSRFRYILISLFSFLYLIFAYREWDSLESAIQAAIPFLILSVSIGIFISTLPVNKPLRFAFLSTLFVPLICFGSEILLLLLSTTLNAAGPMGLTSKSLLDPSLFWYSAAFFVIIGVIFSSLCIIGCYVGFGLQSACSRMVDAIFYTEEYAKQDLKRRLNALVFPEMFTRITAIVLLLIPVFT